MLFIALLSSFALLSSGVPLNPSGAPTSQRNCCYSLAWRFLYRLDLVSCETEAPKPPFGKSYTYRAWPYTKSGRFQCCANRLRESSFANSKSIALKSYKTNGTYESQILQYYRIQCPTNTYAKFLVNGSSINLEARHSLGDQKICLDYVRIEMVSTRQSCEICGNEKLADKCDYIVKRTYPHLISKMLITFRTDPTVEGEGFQLFITCNNNSAIEEEEGCLKTSSYLSWKEYKALTQSEFSEVTNHVPHDATEVLFNFYADHQERSLKAPVESYQDILALAKVAQKSCDASTRTIGGDVQKLFPSSMTRTEEQPWEEYNAEVEEPIQIEEDDYYD